MAVIGSIRKRGTLLMIVIGVSMLAFILTTRVGNMFGEGKIETTVAVINGNKININEYLNRVNEKEAFLTSMNPDASLDENQRQQIGEEVWNDIIRDKVFYYQFDLVGIKVTSEEEADMLTGETIHPSIIQQFRNPQTGMFDPNSVVNYNNQFQDETAVPEDQLQQWRAMRSQWYYFKNYIREDRLSSKYNNLVTKGLYVTSKEAKSNYLSTNNRANVRFVFKPYALIPDSAITLTDEELKKYYNEFKYKFRQKKSRSMKYALFMAIPTSNDSLELFNGINKLKEEWTKSDDDTLFVYENADEPTDPTFYKEGALGLGMDSLLFNAQDGTLAGPIIQNGFYMIGKKLSERMISDSVKARHILLQPTKQEEVEAMRNMRDSLFLVLQKGGNFAQICAMYSGDKSNAQDTGNLGWFTQGMMVPQFNDSCFASEKGQYKKVDTQFGFHIVYIQDKTKPKKQVKVALVNKLIEPSNTTLKEAYSRASEMIAIDQTQKGFEGEKYFNDYTKSKNIIVRDEPFITEGSRSLMGMEGTKDVIKWSLTAKRGELSDVFEAGNSYIVAVVTSVRVDGIPKLEDIKSEVELRAKQHKKAEQFIQEFTSAMGSSNNNIDALAGSLKLQVITANDVTFGSFFIPGAGIEPDLLGVIFGSKPGQFSKPVEGNNGVFVTIIDGMTPAPELPDYTMNKMQMLQGMLGRASNEITNTLKEKAKLQDFRYKFDIF